MYRMFFLLVALFSFCESLAFENLSRGLEPFRGVLSHEQSNNRLYSPAKFSKLERLFQGLGKSGELFNRVRPGSSWDTIIMEQDDRRRRIPRSLNPSKTKFNPKYRSGEGYIVCQKKKGKIVKPFTSSGHLVYHPEFEKIKTDKVIDRGLATAHTFAGVIPDSCYFHPWPTKIRKKDGKRYKISYWVSGWDFPEVKKYYDRCSGGGKQDCNFGLLSEKHKRLLFHNDWAVFFLEESPGLPITKSKKHSSGRVRRNVLTIAAPEEKTFKNSRGNVHSYSLDKELFVRTEGGCEVEITEDFGLPMLRHECDTKKGASGGLLISEKEGIAYGVHRGYARDYNEAVSISEKIIDYLRTGGKFFSFDEEPADVKKEKASSKE